MVVDVVGPLGPDGCPRGRGKVDAEVLAGGGGGGLEAFAAGGGALKIDINIGRRKEKKDKVMT